MTLTIKNQDYLITSSDRFFDNNKDIILLTQGNAPKLGKKALDLIREVKKVNVRKGYTRGTKSFNLSLENFLL